MAAAKRGISCVLDFNSRNYVNFADFNGYKYVLTVVDEISDEVVVTFFLTHIQPDCFASTFDFCTVLIMLCLSAMFGWHIGSLDYAQAYLNDDIADE